MYAKYLRALYQIRDITCSREKKRIRSALYRLAPDWDPKKDPALAVAFASLTGHAKYPGYIPIIQSEAVGLAVQIEKLLGVK